MRIKPTSIDDFPIAEDKRKNDQDAEVKVDSNNVSAEILPVEHLEEQSATSPTKQSINGKDIEVHSIEDHVANRASALTHLTERYLDGTTNSLVEKYQVFLHINANAANLGWQVSQSDCCSLDHKRFLSPNVAKQLACDASIDEHRASSKWQGDSMDIQQTLQCMFEMEPHRKT